MSITHEDRLQRLRKAAEVSIGMLDRTTSVDSQIQLDLVSETIRLRELAASVYVFMSRHHDRESEWLANLLAAAQGAPFDSQTIPQMDHVNGWFREVIHGRAGAILVQTIRTHEDEPAVSLTIHVEGKIATCELAYESNYVRDTAFAEMSDELIYDCVEKMLPPMINPLPTT